MTSCFCRCWQAADSAVYACRLACWQLQVAANTQTCEGSMHFETCQTSVVLYLKASRVALLTACRPFAGPWQVSWQRGCLCRMQVRLLCNANELSMLVRDYVLSGINQLTVDHIGPNTQLQLPELGGVATAAAAATQTHSCRLRSVCYWTYVD